MDSEKKFDSVASCDYQEVSEAEAVRLWPKLSDAWKDFRIPARQTELAVLPELADLRSGRPCVAYSAFMSCARLARKLLGDARIDLLDIGASTAYYREVLDAADVRPWIYRACDFSEAFRSAAKEARPEVQFDVCDASSLPYPDESFNFVVSGCVLIHVLDWRSVIAETSRVSSRFVIFHRTPLHHGSRLHFVKRAYGIPCLEVYESHEAFYSALDEYDLDIVESIPITTLEHGTRMDTIFCEKRNSNG